MSEKSKIKQNDAIVEPKSLVDTGVSTSDSQLAAKPLEKELNGPKGLEPTRYGDWESKGRCYDF